MPDFRSADEVIAYLEKLKALLTFSGVSDCKMQEGSMRADINISVREKGDPKLGVRAEIKNMNSLKAIVKAIEYETERHIDALETGFEELVQETRRWDDNKNQSFSMRNKEDATDYRYFPDAEIMPIVIDDVWLAEVKKNLPELAHEKYERYLNELGLPAQDCKVLTSDKALTDIFDETLKYCNLPKEAANWILVEYINLVKVDGKSLDDVSISGEKIAKLIDLVEQKVINRTTAKEIFAEIYKNDVEPKEYVESHGLGMVSDENLLVETVQAALSENPKSVAEYKDGNMKVVGFFVGIVMRKMGGKADPAMVNKILKELLEQ
jgi:aspartyl-tRNA(Asn)/glutamyl-tRNA(Gln) amidotransferase subunit B